MNPRNILVFSLLLWTGVLNVRARSSTNTPILTSPIFSTNVFGNTFSFQIGSANGVLSNTVWAIYTSGNLTNWFFLKSVTLDATGQSSFADKNLNGQTHQFYKLRSGTNTSQAIGFVQVTVNPVVDGTNKLIADQLIQTAGSNNTLVSAFAATIALDDLPTNAEIQKYSGGSMLTYTYNPGLYPATGWSGTTTLNPGEGASLVNPTDNPLTVTFVGLVPQGQLIIPLGSRGSANLVSFMAPKAGGIQTVLEYNPTELDQISQWRNGQSLVTLYDLTSPDGMPSYWFWYEPDDFTPAPEPAINVGESFFIVPSGEDGEEFWFQSYSDIGGDAPVLSTGPITSSNFTFNAYGDAGAAWTVFSSTNLKNWTPAGSMTLDTNGLGSFVGNNTNWLLYNFYKLNK